VVGEDRRRRGGIASLAGVLEDYCEAIEYDLAERGFDLLDLWRPVPVERPLSWRKLAVLLVNLPPESRFKAEQLADLEDEPVEPVEDDGKFGPWSQAEMLLARIGDGIDQLAFMWTDGKGPRPKPFPRPGVGRTQVTPINKRAQAFLQYIRDHHGAAPPPDWEPDEIAE
jgi:hypothetical protein